MIEITDLHNTSFPVIDFKFLNRGDASGVLWQIGVLIESIEIDPTPVISFAATVERDGSLAAIAENTGWGPANSLTLRVSEPLLGQLFPTAIETGPLSVGSGDRREVLKWFIPTASENGREYLNKVIRDRATFLETLESRMREADRAILEDTAFTDCLCKYERWHIQEYFDFLARGDPVYEQRQQWHIHHMSKVRNDAAPLQDMVIHSTFNDIRGQNQAHDQGVAFRTPGGGQVWITRREFHFEHYQPPCFSIMPPTVTFVVMLNAAAGPTERKYSTSLVIPPGDAERFQMAIGADCSCRVRARCAFYFDAGHTIKSEPFDLAVWRPRGVRVSAEDGAQFVRTEKGWLLADGSGSVTRIGR